MLHGATPAETCFTALLHISFTLKSKGGNLRVVNFVSAYFGTIEPDFSELKQGHGLLLEMNNKTSWKKRFRGLDF